MNIKMEGGKFANLAGYAPAVVRVGLSLVFLWFGSSQLMNPSAWINLLPKEVSMLPLSPETLILLNGGFEIVFGVLLILGVWVRPVALLLALHMLGIVGNLIMMNAGIDRTIVRDFGLAMATTSIFLYGSDRFTLDAMMARRHAASV